MNNQGKFYMSNEFLWGTLFLTPPLGVIVLWIINQDIARSSKKIITLVTLIWYLFIIVALVGAITPRSVYHYNYSNDSVMENTDTDFQSESSPESLIASQITDILNSGLAKKEGNYQSAFANSYQAVMDGLYVCKYECIEPFENEDQLISDSLNNYITLAQAAYNIDGVQGILMNVEVPNQSSDDYPTTVRAFEVRTSKQVFNQIDWDNTTEDEQIHYLTANAEHIWHNLELF